MLNAPPVTALGGISGPLNIRECGGFFRKDGTGFAFGPVGTPVAFVDARIGRNEAGRVFFFYQSDMSRVRVDPGETRWGQQVVLAMEPPRKALIPLGGLGGRHPRRAQEPRMPCPAGTVGHFSAGRSRARMCSPWWTPP